MSYVSRVLCRYRTDIDGFYVSSGSPLLTSCLSTIRKFVHSSWGERHRKRKKSRPGAKKVARKIIIFHYFYFYLLLLVMKNGLRAKIIE